MTPILLIMWTAFQRFILRDNNNNKFRHLPSAVFSLYCFSGETQKIQAFLFFFNGVWAPKRRIINHLLDKYIVTVKSWRMNSFHETIT